MARRCSKVVEIISQIIKLAALGDQRPEWQSSAADKYESPIGLRLPAAQC
jgi:hypothetical protein